MSVHKSLLSIYIWWAVEFLIGLGKILDTTKHAVIVINTLGNGASSSPTNTPNFPQIITQIDNVR